MSKCRFLYNNLITAASMISVSSLRNGLVTSALKNGSGSATLTPSGNFSGSEDLEYIVEIDSIAGGAEVGQATFKWSDGGGMWDATGVTTSATNILLNNGVYIKHTTGVGADFVVGDKWYFKAINLFNAERVIAWDRDSSLRTKELESPNTFTITFTAEQVVDALGLYDHNLTAAATIALWGDDAATFDSDGGAAQVIEAVTWAADKIFRYLTTADRTKKYWQVRIADPTNPDGYIDIGELFLGTYFEPTDNFSYGTGVRDIKSIISRQKTTYGKSKKRFYNLQKQFSYDLNYITDIADFVTMLEALGDKDTGIMQPLYFNEDSAIPANTWMVELEELPYALTHNTARSTQLIMTEVLRSV